MTQFSTELLNFPAQKQDIDKFFHSSLEIAMEDGIDQMVSCFQKRN
jgi:transposase for insertion sequence element IS905